MSSSEHPTNRWALIVGVNYYPQDGNLQGSVADAQDMQKYLEDYTESKANITLLTASVPTESDAKIPPEDPKDWATQKNMILHLQNIIAKAKSGDHVYIHFSGHGTLRNSFGPGETGFGELSLVLFDEEYHASYLRGNHFANALKVMVKKNLTVTVTLDCCYSGGITRGDNVRCIKYDPGIDATSAHFHQECQTLFGSNRDAKMNDDWLVAPEGYAILAACNPHQRAYEVKLSPAGDSEKRGALSYNLLRSLTSLAKLDRVVSHRSLHELMVAKMHSCGSPQTPMRYGNVYRSFFGTLAIPKNMDNALTVYIGNSINQAKDQPVLNTGDVKLSYGKTLVLKAGLIHGISEGDEFFLFSLGSSGSEAKDRLLARAEKVSAFETELTLLGTDMESLLSSSLDLTAKQTSRVSHRRIRVQIPKDSPHYEQWNSTTTSRYSVELVRENNLDTSCLFSVAINDANEYEIISTIQEKMLDLPRIKVNSDTAAHDSMQLIHHLATFKFFEGLVNELPGPEFENMYEISTSKQPGLSGAFEVNEGEIWSFTIKNHTHKPLYMTVLNFQPSWGIVNLYADRGGDDYVCVPGKQDFTGGKKTVCLKMIVPPGYQAAFQNIQVEDVIKVFVSNKPVSFPSLVLPNLSPKLTRSSRSTTCAANLSSCLETFGMRSSRRSGESVDQWSTHSFIIRTSRVSPSGRT